MNPTKCISETSKQSSDLFKDLAEHMIRKAEQEFRKLHSDEENLVMPFISICFEPLNIDASRVLHTSELAIWSKHALKFYYVKSSENHQGCFRFEDIIHKTTDRSIYTVSGDELSLLHPDSDYRTIIKATKLNPEDRTPWMKIGIHASIADESEKKSVISAAFAAYYDPFAQFEHICE